MFLLYLGPKPCRQEVLKAYQLAEESVPGAFFYKLRATKDVSKHF